MDMVHAFWLAFIQGVTEFLPISSSGHLALVPSVFGWPDQGRAFDVAVHVGTLAAVLIYFRSDIRLIMRDWIGSMTSGVSTVYSKLAWSIVFATLLVGIAGVIFEMFFSTMVRNPISIAIATILFGILLGAADILGAKQRSIDSITWRDVLVIGAAQVLALIPGTSRSGITISAGLMMGLSRDAAARFSFLMAIPVITLAGAWETMGLARTHDPVNWLVLGFGVLVSAVVALACIHYFLKYLQRFSLMPFVVYRLILGVILVAMFM
jgi:undecaprenyl-diphosphatase